MPISDFAVVLNNDVDALYELNHFQIPLIGIVDSDMNPQHFLYPFIGNNDSLENLEFFRTITDNVNVSYTTSNLNVLYHYDTIAWFEKENLRYHHNPVIDPQHFRPGALPIYAKKKILDKFKNNKYLELSLSNHTDQDDKDFSQFLKIIKKQDQAKKIDMIDYLPEFCELIGFTL